MPPDLGKAKKRAIVAHGFQPPGTQLWLGGNDLIEEGHHIWDSNGEAFDYSNWAGGGPLDAGSEDCVIICNDFGEWNDVLCDYALAAFCELQFTCS